MGKGKRKRKTKEKRNVVYVPYAPDDQQSQQAYILGPNNVLITEKPLLIPLGSFYVLMENLLCLSAPHRHVFLTMNEYEIQDVYPHFNETPKSPTHMIIFCVRLIHKEIFQPIGIIQYSKTTDQSKELAEALKAFIHDLGLLRLVLVATMSPPTETFHRMLDHIIKTPRLETHADPIIYSVFPYKQILHLYDIVQLVSEFQCAFEERKDMRFVTIQNGLQVWKPHWTDILLALVTVNIYCNYTFDDPKAVPIIVFSKHFLKIYSGIKKDAIANTISKPSTHKLLQIISPFLDIIQESKMMFPNSLEQFYNSIEDIRVAVASARFKKLKTSSVLNSTKISNSNNFNNKHSNKNSDNSFNKTVKSNSYNKVEPFSECPDWFLIDSANSGSSASIELNDNQMENIINIINNSLENPESSQSEFDLFMKLFKYEDIHSEAPLKFGRRLVPLSFYNFNLKQLTEDSQLSDCSKPSKLENSTSDKCIEDFKLEKLNTMTEKLSECNPHLSTKQHYKPYDRIRCVNTEKLVEKLPSSEMLKEINSVLSINGPSQSKIYNLVKEFYDQMSQEEPLSKGSDNFNMKMDASESNQKSNKNNCNWGSIQDSMNASRSTRDDELTRISEKLKEESNQFISNKEANRSDDDVLSCVTTNLQNESKVSSSNISKTPLLVNANDVPVKDPSTLTKILPSTRNPKGRQKHHKVRRTKTKEIVIEPVPHLKNTFIDTNTSDIYTFDPYEKSVKESDSIRDVKEAALRLQLKLRSKQTEQIKNKSDQNYKSESSNNPGGLKLKRNLTLNKNHLLETTEKVSTNKMWHSPTDVNSEENKNVFTKETKNESDIIFGIPNDKVPQNNFKVQNATKLRNNKDVKLSGLTPSDPKVFCDSLPCKPSVTAFKNDFEITEKKSISEKRNIVPGTDNKYCSKNPDELSLNHLKSMTDKADSSNNILHEISRKTSKKRRNKKACKPTGDSAKFDQTKIDIVSEPENNNLKKKIFKYALSDFSSEEKVKSNPLMSEIKNEKTTECSVKNIFERINSECSTNTFLNEIQSNLTQDSSSYDINHAFDEYDFDEDAVVKTVMDDVSNTLNNLHETVKFTATKANELTTLSFDSITQESVLLEKENIAILKDIDNSLAELASVTEANENDNTVPSKNAIKVKPKDCLKIEEMRSKDSEFSDITEFNEYGDDLEKLSALMATSLFYNQRGKGNLQKVRNENLKTDIQNKDKTNSVLKVKSQLIDTDSSYSKNIVRLEKLGSNRTSTEKDGDMLNNSSQFDVLTDPTESKYQNSLTSIYKSTAFANPNTLQEVDDIKGPTVFVDNSKVYDNSLDSAESKKQLKSYKKINENSSKIHHSPDHTYYKTTPPYLNELNKNDCNKSTIKESTKHNTYSKKEQPIVTDLKTYFSASNLIDEYPLDNVESLSKFVNNSALHENVGKWLDSNKSSSIMQDGISGTNQSTIFDFNFNISDVPKAVKKNPMEIGSFPSNDYLTRTMESRSEEEFIGVSEEDQAEYADSYLAIPEKQKAVTINIENFFTRYENSLALTPNLQKLKNFDVLQKKVQESEFTDKDLDMSSISSRESSGHPSRNDATFDTVSVDSACDSISDEELTEVKFQDDIPEYLKEKCSVDVTEDDNNCSLKDCDKTDSINHTKYSIYDDSETFENLYSEISCDYETMRVNYDWLSTCKGYVKLKDILKKCRIRNFNTYLLTLCHTDYFIASVKDLKNEALRAFYQGPGYRFLQYNDALELFTPGNGLYIIERD